MANIAGIRFRSAGKIFYYTAGDLELHTSAYVVVESAHGAAVGRVVIAPDQFIAADGLIESELKPILRLATEEDVERHEAMDQRAHEALIHAKELAGAQGLDMSINGGEFDLDGTQFTAYFTSTDRIDFRGLVRDLSRDIDARVQLLQVGDRDRAKLVDGIDICGERLCCSSWMTNFPSVSIRMAKEQDLPLNPQKISGVCGRLYCCLTFEYDDYKALRGTLPKVGTMLSTPVGEAKVTGIDFNREMVKLWLTDQHEAVEVHAIDFQLQNGVAIRPMELVRKIEGSMRNIAEDSSAPTRLPNRPPAERGRAPAALTPREERPRGRGRGRPAGGDAPQEQGPPQPRPEGRARGEGRDQGPPQPRPDGAGPRPRPNGAGPRPRPDGRAPRPEARAPRPRPAGGRRTGPNAIPAEAQQTPAPQSDAPPPQAQGEAGGDGAARRRRRRRGRGRGGGGGGAPGGDAPQGGDDSGE